MHTPKLFIKKAVYTFTSMLIITGYSCSSNKPSPTDTPTSGEVSIGVDKAFTELINIQKYTFEYLYKHAAINVNYLPEKELINRLLTDSCKVITLSRDLTTDEQEKFARQNIFPISTKIADDAIMVIKHKTNTCKELSTKALKEVLLGKQVTWPTEQSSITAVIEEPYGATALYLQDSLLNSRAIDKKVFTLKTTEEIIQYVSKNKGAIGFISFSNISDIDDPKTKAYLEKVSILPISAGTTSMAFKPSQSTIKSNEYPLTRSIYLINRQTRPGLGMGFVSFIAGEKGQLILLKQGLVPNFQPERTIQINIK